MGKKFTLDLTDQTEQLLNQIKEQRNLPMGQILNELIHLFYQLSPRTKKELLDYSKSRIRELCDEMDKTEDKFEAYTKMDQCQEFLRLATFFNYGKPIDIDAVLAEPLMTTIPLKDGILVYPKDFILLNEPDAKNSNSASVVEVHNAKFSVPHFVYFHNCETPFFTKMETEKIEEMCVKKWPKFGEIMDSQVDPIPDPNALYPFQYLNEEDYLNSPKIGHFDVYVQGDPTFPKNYKPPYDMRIIK